MAAHCIVWQGMISCQDIVNYLLLTRLSSHLTINRHVYTTSYVLSDQDEQRRKFTFTDTCRTIVKACSTVLG
jgi:hypothetical protein